MTQPQQPSGGQSTMAGMFRGVDFTDFIGREHGSNRSDVDDLVGARPTQHSADELKQAFDNLRKGVDDLLTSIKNKQPNFGPVPVASGGATFGGQGPYSTVNGGGALFSNPTSRNQVPSPGTGPTSSITQGTLRNYSPNFFQGGRGDHQLINQPNGGNGGQNGPQTYTDQDYPGMNGGNGQGTPNGGTAAMAGGAAAAYTTLRGYSRRNLSDQVTGDYVSTRIGMSAGANGQSQRYNRDRARELTLGEGGINTGGLSMSDVMSGASTVRGFSPFLADDPRFAQTLGQVGQSAITNPLAGAAGNAAALQGQSTNRAYYGYRAIGVNPFNADGSPQSVGGVANQVANRSAQMGSGRNFDQLTAGQRQAALSQNGGVSLGMQSLVSQGTITQSTADAQLEFLRSQNSALNKGATTQEFQRLVTDATSNDDKVNKAAKSKLRGYGVDDSSVERLRDTDTERRQVAEQIMPHFNEGLQKAAGLLEGFNDKLADFLGTGPGNAAAGAFGTGSGFGGQMGGVAGTIGVGSLFARALGGGAGRLGGIGRLAGAGRQVAGRAMGQLPTAEEVIGGAGGAAGGAGRGAGGIFSRLLGGGGGKALGKAGSLAALGISAFHGGKAGADLAGHHIGAAAGQLGSAFGNVFGHGSSLGQGATADPGDPAGGILADILNFFGHRAAQSGGPSVSMGGQYAPNQQGDSGFMGIENAVKQLGIAFSPPSTGQTTGGSHASNSEHYQGRAVDFGDATSNPGQIAKALEPYAKGANAPIDELIFAPLGIGYKNGTNIGERGYGASTWNEHRNHVHVGVRAGVDLASIVKGGPGAAGASATGAGGTGQTAQSNNNKAASGGGGGGAQTSEASAIAAALSGGGGGGGQQQQSNDSTGASTAQAGGASGNAPGGMPSGNVASWIRTALGIMHMDYNKYAPGISKIINFESSGNPHAQNNTDSNAKAGHPSKGIMQTIDSTFNSYALPGHHDIWNPVDNIIAAVRYGLKTYGDSWLVGGGNAAHGSGYAKGSWELVRDEIAQLHKGEMIIPAKTAEKVRAAVQNGTTDSGGGVVISFAQGSIQLNANNAKDGQEAARAFVDFIARDTRIAALGR